MNGLISFSYGGAILLSKVTFTDCFLYETMYYSDRGMLLYADNLYGSIDLSSVTITNFAGLNTTTLTQYFGGKPATYQQA